MPFRVGTFGVSTSTGAQLVPHGLGRAPGGVITLTGAPAAANTTYNIAAASVGIAAGTSKSAASFYAQNSTGAASGNMKWETAAGANYIPGTTVGSTSPGNAAQFIYTSVDSVNISYTVTSANTSLGPTCAYLAFTPRAEVASGLITTPTRSTGTSAHSAEIHLLSGSITSGISFGLAAFDGSLSQGYVSLSGADDSTVTSAYRRQATTAVALLMSPGATAVSVEAISALASSVSTAWAVTVPSTASLVLSALAIDAHSRAGSVIVSSLGVASVSNLGAAADACYFLSYGGPPSLAAETDVKFSVGVAASNAQAGVGTFFKHGVGSSLGPHGQTLLSDTAAVVFVTSAGVESRGVWARSTGGFTVTFDNTAASGYEVLYLALTEGTSATTLSNSSIAGSTGVVKAKSQTVIRTRGDDEETRVLTENSSSPDISKYMRVTTVKSLIGASSFRNASEVFILPPDLSTVPLRLTRSTDATGIPLAPTGMSHIGLSPSVLGEMYLYTTQSGSTVNDVRIIIR